MCFIQKIRVRAECDFVLLEIYSPPKTPAANISEKPLDPDLDHIQHIPMVTLIICYYCCNLNDMNLDLMSNLN